MLSCGVKGCESQCSLLEQAMERKGFEDDEKEEGNPDDTLDFRVLFPLAALGAE